MPAADDRSKLRAFQTLLDPTRTATERHVSLTALRRWSQRGIPDHPPHLRPIAYSLLLGTLPADKHQWRSVTKQHRQHYHTFLRAYTEQLDSASPPTDPLSPNDALLVRISKDVERVGLAVLHSHTTPSVSSPLAPPRRGMPTQVAAAEEDTGDQSSSSADGERNEDEERSELRKNRRRPQRAPATPILTRRAPFARVEMCLGPTFSGSHSPNRQSFSAAGKGKGKEESPQIVLPDGSGEGDGPADGLSSMLEAPSLRLTIPSEPTSSNPPSPITLYSPQANRDVLPGSTDAYGDQADTHMEAIVRLIYIFCLVNKQWQYAPSFVDIIIPLYFIYAEISINGDHGDAGDNGGRYAEEDTYWAFAALMGEFGDIVGANGDGVNESLEKLSRRVRWADEQLWAVLRERNLDPASPLYTYQWVTSLLAQDRTHLLPVWDFILSEPPSSSKSNPKLELLLDVCASMIGLCKRLVMIPPAPQSAMNHTMWHDEPPSLEAEDPEAAFVRCLQLFRSYPIEEVGGLNTLLRTSYDVHHARLLAIRKGDDPDSPGWSDARDASQTNWAAAKFRQAANGASAVNNRLWNQYSSSNAAASLSKASTNWTASAMAKFSGAAMPSAPAAPDWKGISAAAGKWWNRNKSSDASYSGDEWDKYSSLSSTTVSSVASPVTASNHPYSPRRRSDSLMSSNSALSVGSLQERLSGLASGFGGQPRVTSGPKPLLLSTSARKASNTSSSSSTTRTRLGTSPRTVSPSEHHLYRLGGGRRRNGGSDYGSDGTGTPPMRRKRESLDTISTYDSIYSSKRYDSPTAEMGLGLLPEGLPTAQQTPMPAAPAPRQPSPKHAPPAALAPEEPPEPISIPTPQIAHLTEDDYEHVYEPAEDSFILLDALEADAAVLRDAKPVLCVEIGSGSGIASTFVQSLLGAGEAYMLSTDINPFAAAATLRTGEANDVALNPVLCNLLDPLPRLRGQIDLLIFNPPYVETESVEMVDTQAQRDIGGAWAGGTSGMQVTNRVLDELPTLLAPGGRFYLVAIHQNRPDEIIARMRAAGMECKTVIKRRAGRELLSVIRIIRPLASVPAYMTAPRASPRKRGAAPALSAPSPLHSDGGMAADEERRGSLGEDYEALLDAYGA